MVPNCDHALPSDDFIKEFKVTKIDLRNPMDEFLSDPYLYNVHLLSPTVTAHNRTVRGGSSGSFSTQNMMEWEQKRQQGIQGISPSAFALAKHNEAKIFVKSI